MGIPGALLGAVARYRIWPDQLIDAFPHHERITIHQLVRYGATDSDLVVCAEHATFFDTHVKVGLVAGLEPVGLARRIPLESVLRMALLGGSERMSAEEAKSLGLVGEIVPKDQLMPRARELAQKIAQHSPAALQRTKRAIWESLDIGLDDALTHTWAILGEHNTSPDPQEGAKAFVEKRKPHWAPFTS